MVPYHLSLLDPYVERLLEAFLGAFGISSQGHYNYNHQLYSSPLILEDDELPSNCITHDHDSQIHQICRAIYKADLSFFNEFFVNGTIDPLLEGLKEAVIDFEAAVKDELKKCLFSYFKKF
jgi:hypothetical protein